MVFFSRKFPIINLLLLCLVISGINVSGALAESCGELPEVAEAYRDADAVFAGRATGKKDSKGKHLILVEHVYKGNVGKQEFVSGYFAKDRLELIYALGDNKRGYFTHSCDRGQVTSPYWLPRELLTLSHIHQKYQALDEAIVALPEQRVGLLILKAEDAMMHKDYQRAADTLYLLFDMQPDDDRIYVQLIEALFQLRKPEDIWKVYTRFQEREEKKNPKQQDIFETMPYTITASGDRVYRLSTDQLKKMTEATDASHNKPPREFENDKFFRAMTYAAISLKKTEKETEDFLLYL